MKMMTRHTFFDTRCKKRPWRRLLKTSTSDFYIPVKKRLFLNRKDTTAEDRQTMQCILYTGTEVEGETDVDDDHHGGEHLRAIVFLAAEELGQLAEIVPFVSVLISAFLVASTNARLVILN